MHIKNNSTYNSHVNGGGFCDDLRYWTGSLIGGGLRGTVNKIGNIYTQNYYGISYSEYCKLVGIKF